MIPVRFTDADAQRAHDEWGANCGPGAIAAILGLTLNELRPHMGDFEQKHYTNPTLMWDVLYRLKVKYKVDNKSGNWPYHGLARVQWEGPWTRPGVPMRARYRHTHWVAAIISKQNGLGVFDINAMNSGGWIAFSDWNAILVPWIIENLVPKADGKWHITHTVEIT
jgi:hypothetical protein